ncbi:MAG: MarR family transcriptional regulator [Nostocoides sp.]
MPLSLATATQLSTDLVGVFKLFAALKQHAPRFHEGVEPAAYPVLFNLVDGPRRVSALADCIHSDVSTVSRQVTTLAAHGLVDKIPDPADGRAAMVSLSDTGLDLVDQLKAGRGAWIQQILDDWEPAQAEQLIERLGQFTRSFEKAKEAGTLFPPVAHPSVPVSLPSPQEH